MTDGNDYQIRRERPGGFPSIEIITVDREPVNAVSSRMYEEIAATFNSFVDNDAIRCIILTGAGRKAFIGGADVREFLELDAASGPSYMKLRRRSFESVRDCPVPVIGAINGHALGAGVAYAAACDILIASESATFGVPEINVGVLGGARHLARLVPPQLVRYLTLTGRRLTAKHMYELGALCAVVPNDELLDAALEIASEITEKSKFATRLAKEGLNLIENLDLRDGYHVEQLNSIILSALPDSKIAVQAFLDKTKPVF